MAFATRLYTTALSRTADGEGVYYWAYRMANYECTGTEAAYGFFFSDELVNQNISDSEFITRMYRTFFNREPDQAGYNYWYGVLEMSHDRVGVFYAIAGCEEFAVLCTSAGIYVK